MKIHSIIPVCLTCLFAAPVFAQPQIGGGTCDSSSLNGAYSLSLNGRVVNSSVAFTNVLQGIGSVTFDGLSKVTFTFANNTNKSYGMAQTQSGTYSLQSNCIGVLNITSGGTASYTLESYNQGKDFLMTGQDGTYSLMGSGSLLPTSCTAPSGIYSFNGNGFTMASGAIASVNYISGLIQFTAPNAITTTWYLATNGSSQTAASTSGTFTVTGCTATANITDSSGNTYALVFTITASNGANFVLSGANAQLIFSGSGRIL